MPFDWPKFQASTPGMRREIKWSYFNAICAYFWGHCTGLDDDDETLRAVCECFNPAEWARTKGTIFGPFFQKNGDGKWHQKRAKEEYLKALAACEAATNRGKAGAAARWDKSEEDKQCSSNAQAMLEVVVGDAPTHTHTPLTTPAPSPTQKPDAAQRVIFSKELDRVNDRIKTIRSSYDQHSDMTDEDKTQLRNLNARRKELRVALGVKY